MDKSPEIPDEPSEPGEPEPGEAAPESTGPHGEQGKDGAPAAPDVPSPPDGEPAAEPTSPYGPASPSGEPSAADGSSRPPVGGIPSPPQQPAAPWVPNAYGPPPQTPAFEPAPDATTAKDPRPGIGGGIATGCGLQVLGVILFFLSLTVMGYFNSIWGFLWPFVVITVLAGLLMISYRWRRFATGVLIICAAMWIVVLGPCIGLMGGFGG